jgi:hypothetical protein
MVLSVASVEKRIANNYCTSALASLVVNILIDEQMGELHAAAVPAT